MLKKTLSTRTLKNIDFACSLHKMPRIDLSIHQIADDSAVNGIEIDRAKQEYDIYRSAEHIIRQHIHRWRNDRRRNH